MQYAVYATSLYCQAGSSDAVYHIQMMQIDGGKNRYAVNAQYGKSTGKLAATKGKPMTFDRAATEFRKTVSAKTTNSGQDRVYLESSILILPMEVELMSSDERLRVEQGFTKLIPMKKIDLDDPQLQACIADDMWLGVVFSQNEHTLTKLGNDVFLDASKLALDHPFSKAAHEIGGEFKFAGYVENEAFYAFDVIDDGYKSYDYGRRIQMMANFISEAEIDAIQCATFMVGKDRKDEAVASVGTTTARVRFMRMDDTYLQGEVCIYPTIDD